MRVLVCGAAPEPDGEEHYRSLLSAARFVVAADAGAEWAVGLGRVPEIAVGDFDSALPGAVERLRHLGVEVVVYPADKDASDLDLALAEARKRGADAVTFTAMTSRRLDHTLAALGTMAGAADLSAELDEPSLGAWPLDAGSRPALALEGLAGALVSVFAFDGTAEGVTETGMCFPLQDARLAPFSSLGLSNALAGYRASVSLTGGRALVLAQGPPHARARMARG
ncbi:MAG TPA: thiamine diphosphokinase [Coriobacteriia bacterium]|jgi:thiamine pyrophosphokinase